MWTKVVDGDAGEWFTRVVFESTRPYKYTVRNNIDRVIFETEEALLNMPEGVSEVNDGLLRELAAQKKGGVVSIEMMLDHPSEFRVNNIEGFPFRVEVLLQRSAIIKLFNGKKFLLDPGHGGDDMGGKGPVSLYEKDVVLNIAKNLEKILHRVNAEVKLTRYDDRQVTVDNRYGLVAETGADIYIGIHNHASENNAEEGIATLFAPSNEDSAVLAGLVQESLVEKLKAFDRGIGVQTALEPVREVPAIEVEVLTITNQVEEVFLRGLTILDRAAEGIFNGLIKYYAQTGAKSKGDVS